MKKCKAKCIRNIVTKGYCRAHYLRFKDGRDMNTPLKIRGGLRSYIPHCSIEKCKRPVIAKKLCQPHYHRSRYGLDMNSPIRIFDYVSMRDGYRVLFINSKEILEHRYIMERHLKRKLKSSEIVHHKNENRSDNRISNLLVMTRSEHMKHHQNIKFGHI